MLHEFYIDSTYLRAPRENLVADDDDDDVLTPEYPEDRLCPEL